MLQRSFEISCASRNSAVPGPPWRPESGLAGRLSRHPVHHGRARLMPSRARSIKCTHTHSTVGAASGTADAEATAGACTCDASGTASVSTAVRHHTCGASGAASGRADAEATASACTCGADGTVSASTAVRHRDPYGPTAIDGWVACGSKPIESRQREMRMTRTSQPCLEQTRDL